MWDPMLIGKILWRPLDNDGTGTAGKIKGAKSSKNMSQSQSIRKIACSG